jgi:hypothetical protein
MDKFFLTLFVNNVLVNISRTFANRIVESERKFGLQGLIRVEPVYELPFVLHLRKS